MVSPGMFLCKGANVFFCYKTSITIMLISSSTDFHRSCANAFTLIELLIVIAIIGILAAIAVPNFLNARIRAQNSRVMADFRSLGTALETYALDENAAPWDAPCPSGDHGWASCFARLTTPISYMNAILPDPYQAEDVIEALRAQPAHFVGARLSYDYATIYFNGGLNSPSNTWLTLYGRSLWRIASAGPDKALTNDPARRWVSPPYKVSNGLHSLGDIVYSQENFLTK